MKFFSSSTDYWYMASKWYPIYSISGYLLGSTPAIWNEWRRVIIMEHPLYDYWMLCKDIEN